MDNFKINRDKKTFVFDDGEEIPIPKDKVRQVLRTPHARELKEKEKAKYKKEGTGAEAAFTSARREGFLGNAASSTAEYLESGGRAFTKGKGQENLGYIDRVLDNFYALQEGRKENAAELAQAHPVAAGFGTGLGVLSEVGGLGKLPAKVALPIMGAGHSETSFLEPLEKGQELGKDYLKGLVLDKFFGGVGKIVKNRSDIRTAKKNIENIEKMNISEVEKARLINEANQAEHLRLQGLRNAEVQGMGAKQAGENKAFADTSAENVNRISKVMGKGTVGAETLGVDEFIENAINLSANAGTSEANQASKFLKTVFKGDAAGKMTADNLKKGMTALDEAILTREGATKQILQDYRNFLLDSLPQRLSNAVVYEKWAPKFVNAAVKGLEGEINQVIQQSPHVNQILIQKFGNNYIKNLNNNFRKAIEKILGNYKGDIVASLQNGSLQQEISQSIRGSKDYNKIIESVDQIIPKTTRGLVSEINAELVTPGIKNVQKTLSELPDKIASNAVKYTEKYANNLSSDLAQSMKVSERNVQQIPRQPNIIPEPPPVAPPVQATPNLQPVPTVPNPQGVYGKLASGLEKFNGQAVKDSLGALKNNASMGILAKIAGIPVGKIVGGGVAGISGASALTSPTRAGNALRTGLKQGAVVAYEIEERASSYPSYHDGVLENPQERRSLTKEIEDDPDISLEDKAIFQSKINRGKPLSQKL